MAEIAKGMGLYALIADPDNAGKKKILLVNCPLGMTVGEDNVEAVDNTTLCDTVRQEVDGMITPGDTSFQLAVDKAYESHRILYQMANGLTQDGKKPVRWALGLFDGEQRQAPELNHDQTDWILPSGRDWWYWDAHVRAFPLDAVTPGEKVTVNVTLKRSTRAFWAYGEPSQTTYPASYDIELSPAASTYLRVGGEWTGAIADDASANDVEGALEALSGVETAVVTGTSGNYNVTLDPPAVLSIVGEGATIKANA